MAEQANDAATVGHFPGCHPEDEKASEEHGTGHQPQDTEDCWHCGTPATRGACNCPDCWDSADIPPSAIYHCRTCGRWWAWMTGLNITTITFGEEAADG